MLSKYADTLKRRGLDTCSSQILADVLESFPKSVSVKQLAHNTGKTEKYIKSKIRAMKRDDVPITLKRGSRNNYVTTSMFEPCLLYTSPSPRDLSTSRMPSSA